MPRKILTCHWCAAPFEPYQVKGRLNRFCCIEHRLAYQTWCRTKAIGLFEAMERWRDKREKGAMGDVCHLWAMMRLDRQELVAKAKDANNVRLAAE